jgi:intracellular septation protein
MATNQLECATCQYTTYIYQVFTPSFNMHFLIEFFPVIIFFVAYKFYAQIPVHIIESVNTLMPVTLTPGSVTDSIYFATLIAIIISGITVIAQFLKNREINKNQALTFVLFIIFGGATLLLRDPVFIKWKPSAINLIFALVFLGSAFIGKKPLVERLLGNAISAPRHIWLKLNTYWVVFFTGIAVINLYIAYNFSEEVWVNFKLFGMIGLTFLFIIMQIIILSRYSTIKSEE